MYNSAVLADAGRAFQIHAAAVFVIEHCFAGLVDKAEMKLA